MTRHISNYNGNSDSDSRFHTRPATADPITDQLRIERALQEALFRQGHRNPLGTAGRLQDAITRHGRATRLARALAEDTETTLSGPQVARILLDALTGPDTD